ncbi:MULTISPECIES: 50S ribosomal protein L18 [Gammaproteobacteria]|jgi:large subunit ribosomal protein L18|uniref:Large ribosomal subunit protein uL18 n=2 Tax=Halomonadaceae TaxID=28256 RepID=A0A2A2EUK9_9GAMM|nr:MULTISPECIES: 50S ribosomal protein L18 [Gammaproteobacteria]KAA8982578.1 50S ribosomal protein L18 [Halospina sp. K52047b]MYL27606.1 50S ribosomal protein L18 [Halomonas utahensis]MYL75943.1 50S ribosomal protein L18 [Halomonas sp. 22501_18_FS]PAU76348.1 50S ribosomal protein L18 [Halovibrio salipaludis]
MSAKKESRLRRARKVRIKIRERGSNRLCVHRTPRHMYAQVTTADGSQVLAAASTLDKELRQGATGNVDAARQVGELIAERAKNAGIETVAFDRSGYRYHGRVKALADAAREAGLQF